ncbi:MAG: PorT family protein [Saprospiraceae bacterium]|nr:PorT family protein [Saprospiraceae bacterium]
MKQILIFPIVLLIGKPVKAQDDNHRDHDTLFSGENFKKNSSHRNNKIKTRYGLVDFGFNALSASTTYRLENGIDPFELRLFKSTNLNLHLVQQRLSLAKRHLNLVYGLSLESHRYSFDNPVILLADTPEAKFQFFENRRFKKNRLASTYLTLPILFNIKSNPRYPYRSFHLSAGGYASLLLGANFKTKEKGNKDKIKDNYGLNTFRYGLRGEIGYGPLILYTTIDLNNLFEKDKDNGYKVTPFSIGLVIWPF